MGDPALEGMGLWLAALEDERVEARLRDDERIATTSNPNTIGVGLGHLVIIENGVNGVSADAERVAYVLGDEPRLSAIVCGHSQVTELGIVENSYNVVVHVETP